MPVYQQRKDWFFIAMDALCQQTYKDKEIVVSGIVDDPALEWAKKFEGVKVVDSRIPDPKRQINEGIKAAEGEVVVQAASDDLMIHTGLEKMVDLYREKDAVMAYPDTEYCDEELNLMYVHYAAKILTMEDLYKTQVMSDCALVSRAVLHEFGLFDIGLSKFAVWDMWLKIAGKYLSRIHHAGCVAWKYRRHDNALGRTGYGEEYREKFHKRWGITHRYSKLPPAMKAVLIDG